MNQKKQMRTHTKKKIWKKQQQQETWIQSSTTIGAEVLIPSMKKKLFRKIHSRNGKTRNDCKAHINKKWRKTRNTFSLPIPMKNENAKRKFTVIVTVLLIYTIHSYCSALFVVDGEQHKLKEWKIQRSKRKNEIKERIKSKNKTNQKTHKTRRRCLNTRNISNRMREWHQQQQKAKHFVSLLTLTPFGTDTQNPSQALVILHILRFIHIK